MFTTKYAKVIDKDSEYYNQIKEVLDINFTDRRVLIGMTFLNHWFHFYQVTESTKEEYEAQNQPQLISGQEAILKVGDKEITVIIK